jgi:hypothetical protein
VVGNFCSAQTRSIGPPSDIYDDRSSNFAVNARGLREVLGRPQMPNLLHSQHAKGYSHRGSVIVTEKFRALRLKSLQRKGCKRWFDFHFMIAGNVLLSHFELQTGQLDPESPDLPWL